MREEIRIPSNGIPRHAILHTPPSAGGPVPLVLLLHGKGGTAEWVLEETRMIEFAEREGFALLAPDALPIDPTAEPKFLTNPQVWNADPHNELADELPDDMKFLGDLLSHVESRGTVDRSLIYVTGFSNGAAMTFRLAAEMEDRIAAIAPVAGNFALLPHSPSRPVPTLWLVGEKDPLMPVEGGLVKSPWGREYHRPAVMAEARRWARAMQGEGELTRVEILPDLGHHWPGGMGRLNPKIFGPANAGVPGNAMIWDFFRKYHRA